MQESINCKDFDERAEFFEINRKKIDNEFVYLTSSFLTSIYFLNCLRTLNNKNRYFFV